VTAAGWELANFNIARLLAPLDAAENREFTAALEPVNALAEVSDGFLWRLKADDGRSASYVETGGDPREIVNLTVWRDVAALGHFAYRSGHGAYFRRRAEWFEADARPRLVLWWVPAGLRPAVPEGFARLARLRATGPSPEAFTLAQPFEPPVG
jgi:hypothetical protein